MTATGTKPVTRCRRCETPIRPAGSGWIDCDGWENCDGTDDPHQPFAVCRVVDLITQWTDKDGELRVREGDLILRDYRLELIERLYYDPIENIMIRVELAGHSACMFVQPADFVAVRRYITEETP
jgi:hypothetical protein